MGSLWPGPWWLVLLVALCFIVPSIAVWAAEHEYEEKDYSGGFSTDLFFPYLDYNEKDGAIPGFDWDASSDMGVHRLSGRGGVGTDSGKEQLMLGYTYLGWYPALGANLFDRNTFFEDYTDNNNDEDDWLKELGGNLFVSWPFDVYHRISFAYELESVDMPNETTRLSSVSLSLVRDTAQYYMLETISGTQVNLTAEHGHDSLGSEQNFESYSGDLRLYGNVDLGRYFWFGERLTAALRVHGGLKKDDLRYFHLGGSDGLRGYDYHEFWGEKMWATSLEFHYPALIIRRTTTGWDLFHFHQLLAVAFVDAGKVWRRYDDKEKENDFYDFVHDPEVGAGAGVRLQMFLFGKIPLVVGLDVAHSLTDRERDWHLDLVLGLGL